MYFKNKTQTRPFAIMGAALLATTISGCATPTGPVGVTRFADTGALIEVNGQYQGSFAIQNNGALALSPYRSAVAREMQRLGFTPVQSGQNANYIVNVNVDRFDSERPKNNNVSVGGSASTGSFGSGLGLGLGLDLSGRKKRTNTELLVRISENNQSVWEGRAVQSAKTGSPAAQEGIAASKLASALFQGFPGRSGETIEVP